VLIEGQYLAPGGSRAWPARLQSGPGGVELQWDDQVHRYGTDELRVSDRLARLPRRIEFPDGGTFTTPDNDGVDAALARLGAKPRASLVDRMERRWTWALAAVLALPLCLWLLFTQGLPVIAGPLSMAVPERVTDLLDDTLLELLETQVFEPTALEPERQAEITALLDTLEPETPIDLLYRGGGLIGANALALPGGTVILTDELVGLAEHDGELSAVLAHEIAHVRHRHALRSLIQTVGAATVLGWVFGDLSFVTDLALVSAPALVQQLGYTRDFEREADEKARRMLSARGIPVRCLASMMQRLEEHVGDGADVGPGWLQTHPGFDERIAAASTGPACGD
jgi:Zn-dependent protease with chaperone function